MATHLILAFSRDGLSQLSSGDFQYTPSFSTSSINSSSTLVLKGLGGVWLIKDNWINGSIPRNVQPGNYYVKICDDQNDVISTDVYITAVVLATLQVSPSSGPGDVQVQLTGSGYPASQPVTISYFDDYAGWGYLRSVTADSNGQISFSQQMPDLGRSLGVGDNPEACNQQTFKAESGGYVAYADYNQTMRGIKNVGGEIASGLFGNGTYLGGSVRSVTCLHFREMVPS